MKNVTAALKSLPGVSAVEVDLQSGYVTVNGDLIHSGDPLVLALAAAGYPAKLVAAPQMATSAQSAKKSGDCCG